MKKLKIGLVGYGRMGKLIHQIAESRGHEVVATINDGDITQESIKNAEVLIDFSFPVSAIDNLKKASKLGVSYVMGTTGWTDRMSEVEEIVKKNDMGFIWSSNFSLSVQLFFKIVREASRLINPFDDFDIAGVEAHHKHKLDSPSGTAETMAKIVLEEVDRKKKLCLDRPEGKISEDELHIATMRVGEVPGTHKILIDTESDTIEIKNTSRSRGGFATGSVVAAEFIAGKKGFYDFGEVI